MAAGSNQSPVFDFTSLDFDSIRNDLIRYAQATFPGELWTDFNDSNFGTFLLDLISYATDLIAYSENSHVLETVAATVIREQNFRNIAKTYDFVPKGAVPSTTVLTFGLSTNPLDYPVTIPSETKLGTVDSIVFQPDIPTSLTFIAATGLGFSVNVPATQGDEIFENGASPLGTSDGSTGQRYTLLGSPLIDGTLSVKVSATPYVIILNFIEAGPSDEVCTVNVDENGIGTITFGDGINGKIPPIGLNINAVYKTGGGTNTNLPAGTIKEFVGTPPLGVLSVINNVSATGGGPKQTLANAKMQLPLVIKSNERAVTSQDYATIAVQDVPSVLKAAALDGIFLPGGTAVLLYIVAQGGIPPTPALANQIITTFRFGTGAPGSFGKGMAGKRVIIRSPVFVNMVIDVDAFVDQGASAVVVGSRVRERLAFRYQLENVDFGIDLDLQDAYSTVDPFQQQIEGLRRVFFRGFTIRPYFAAHINQPVTGNGTVDGIVTSLGVARREWLIRFVIGAAVPAGTRVFQVLERRLGTITTLSDTSLLDEGADYVNDELLTTANNWVLHVQEQVQPSVRPILGNTVDSIQIDSTFGGLLALANPGDSYAVERTDGNGSNSGKVLRTTAVGVTLGGALTVPVVLSSGFVTGNRVLLRDGANSQVLVVASAAVGSITFTTTTNFTVNPTATLDWFWQSVGGTVGFAVVNGTTIFAIGDEIYVDTYPLSGDLTLRPENFPVLDALDLHVVTIGGTK